MVFNSMPYASKKAFNHLDSPTLAKRLPQLERDPLRTTELGYEAPEDAGFIRYLEHGFPTPLARWHYHDEYELHLITESQGRVFVGDYIGHFEPGHLVLTGPRVPHNWVSTDVPSHGIEVRDKVIQFLHAPLRDSAVQMPELAELMPLLERARHGIEFFDVSNTAADYFSRIKSSHGLSRLVAFYELMGMLASCKHYRLLSNVKIESSDDSDTLDRINHLVNEITLHVGQDFSAKQMAQRFDMSESSFSRFFRRATGNTFTDFVNGIRISKACHLLVESDSYVTSICYEVGFNNLANFNRRFLQLKGISPKEYRRQALERFNTKAVTK